MKCTIAIVCERGEGPGQGTRVLDKGSDLDQEMGEAHPIDGKETDGGEDEELAKALWVELSSHKEGRGQVGQLGRAAQPAANGTGPAASPKCTTRPMSAPNEKLYLTQS